MTERNEHLELLIMRYADGTISPEEEVELQRFLDRDDESKREFEQTRELTELLRINKERIFCPDTEELYDYAVGNVEPTARMDTHLEICQRCRDEVEIFRVGCDERISAGALGAFQEIIAKKPSPREEPAQPGLWDQIVEWFSGLLQTPLPALGTAAAALLVAVIVLYPSSEPQPYTALSSVQWDQAPPKFMGTPKAIRPKVAILIQFMGQGKPPSQEEIDTLYRALEPGPRIRRAYQVISPSKIQTLMKEKPATDGIVEDLTGSLRTQFDAASLLLLTVEKTDAGRTVSGRFLDTKYGKDVRSESAEVAEHQDLAGALKSVAISLLAKN